MRKGIVIFADADDENAQFLFNQAKSLSANPIFIDTKKLALSYDLYIDLENQDIKFLHTNAKKFNFFVRAVNLIPLNPFSFSSSQKYNEYRNYYSLMFSFLETLKSEGLKVVNPPSTFWCHYFKPYTYYLAQKVGLKIPTTIITPSFRQIYKTYKIFLNQKQKLIIKPIAGGETVKELNEETLEKIKLSTTVYILQEKIQGTNIRIFTLGNKFLCAFSIEYDTNKSIDYRDLNPKELKIKTTKVSNEIKKLSLKLAKDIGLLFSGIDFIVKNNDYYFLDINPAPMFAGFEFHSSFPISQKIIEYLSN